MILALSVFLSSSYNIIFNFTYEAITYHGQIWLCIYGIWIGKQSLCDQRNLINPLIWSNMAFICDFTWWHLNSMYIRLCGCSGLCMSQSECALGQPGVFVTFTCACIGGLKSVTKFCFAQLSCGLRPIYRLIVHPCNPSMCPWVASKTVVPLWNSIYFFFDIGCNSYRV